MKKTTTETIETKEVFESTIDLAAAKQEEITRLKAKVDAAKKSLEAAKKVLSLYLEPSEKYAIDNQDELFDDPENQRAETANAAYELKRSNNPSVNLEEGLDDDEVIAKIDRSKSLNPAMKNRFIAVKRSLARQAIIDAAKAGEISSAALKRLGVSVECKKTLYVESKAA